MAKGATKASNTLKTESMRVAQGWSDIKTDTVHFVEGDNEWIFPSLAVMPITRVYKYRYEAKVADLRKLAKLMKIKPERL